MAAKQRYQALPPIARLTEHLLHWNRLWATGHLHTYVSIRYSRRLTRCLGRCYPATGQIVLSVPLLQEYPDEILPTLCHEAAHVAVYLKYGWGCRPHGTEWRSLVRQAGFEAERTFKQPLGPSEEAGWLEAPWALHDRELAA